MNIEKDLDVCLLSSRYMHMIYNVMFPAEIDIYIYIYKYIELVTNHTLCHKI